MKISKVDRPALILVDLQQGFNDIAYWGGQRNNPHAEENASKLLRFWRASSLPVFHVQHCSSNPNSPLRETHPGNQFIDSVKPMGQETVIKKKVNSAFIGTHLEVLLHDAHITKLVIVGLTTDHCISTTTRMAGNLGFETFIIADATATFNKKGLNGEEYSAELMHETALASLNKEFATVLTIDLLMAQMQ